MSQVDSVQAVLPDTVIHRILISPEESTLSEESFLKLSEPEQLAYFIAVNHSDEVNESLYMILHEANLEQVADLRFLNFNIPIALDVERLGDFSSKLYPF